MSKYIYKYLNDDDFLSLSKKIKDVETFSSVEIILSIKEKRNFIERLTQSFSGNSIDKLALKEFNKHKLYNTRDKTGVLVFMIFRTKEIYILADEGVNKFFGQDKWNNIIIDMQKHFKNGDFYSGLSNCIIRIGETVRDKLPVKPDDINEISNKIIIT